MILRVTCPDCGGRVAPLPLFRYATDVRRRRCQRQRCRQQWQVIVEPLLPHREGFMVHKMEWTRLA